MAIKYRPAQRKIQRRRDNQRRERTTAADAGYVIDPSNAMASSFIAAEMRRRIDAGNHRYHNSRINPGAAILLAILEPNEAEMAMVLLRQIFSGRKWPAG